jgi:hypothetical protein
MRRKAGKTTAELEERVLVYLRQHGPQTCSNLGAALWGNNHRKPQSFARPAGKILHKLLRAGLVRKIHDPYHILWQAK